MDGHTSLRPALAVLLLLLLLLLLPSSAEPPAAPCLCSALRPPAGPHLPLLRVNCSGAGLPEVPPLPPRTAQLHLRDNRLTAVPPGAFDGLADLREVWLSGNPFRCDCGIRYLRDWLRENGGVVRGGAPTCAGPEPVARREIARLGDDTLAPCAAAGRRRWDGPLAAAADVVLAAAALCGLVPLSLWCLWLAKHAAFTLDMATRHAGLEVASLRSRKPRHRRRFAVAPPSG